MGNQYGGKKELRLMFRKESDKTKCLLRNMKQLVSCLLVTFGNTSRGHAAKTGVTELLSSRNRYFDVKGLSNETKSWLS